MNSDDASLSQHSGPPTPARKWSTWALLALVSALTAAAYWPGLGGGFIFDDEQNILLNPALQVVDPTWGNWVQAAFSSPSSDLQRPLAMVTFALNHYFTGFDPWPMKLTNLLIHLFNAVLVYFLARRVIALAKPGDSRAHSRWPALFVTACWAMHPINLMVVLYVVQRMESLSQLFVLLGLLLYIAGRTRQMEGARGWPLIAAALLPCTLLGLLAKESAVLLPLYALCLEWLLFHFRNRSGNRDRNLYLVFTLVLVIPALVGCGWLLSRYLQPGAFASRNFTMPERLLTEGRILVDYLHWTVLPDLGRLSLYHDDYPVSHGLLQPVSTLFSILLLFLLLAMAWRIRHRRPLSSLGIAWFFSAQLLTATFIPLELVFEHRNYFASLGVCLVLADVLLLLPSTPARIRMGQITATLLFLLFAGSTYLRSNEWSNPLRFAESEAAKHPESPRATYELARMYIVVSRYDPKSPFTGKAQAALDRARKAPGSGILPDQAALMLAARTGQPMLPVWWQDMQAKLRLHPTTPENQMALISLNNCVVHELCKFPADDMMATFATALETPNPGTLSIYGKYALYVIGDPELALRLWTEATGLDPGNAQHRINLALLLIDLGHYEQAQFQIREFRKLGRFGQYDDTADKLEQRLGNARKAPKGK